MDFLKANFSHEEILKALELYAFDLKGSTISDLTGIANNNYRISGKNFDIALKVYSHGQSDNKKIEKEVEVLKLFRQKGKKVPELIEGKNNKIVQNYKGFNVVATNFINGNVFDSVSFTPQRMFEVGQIVTNVEETARKINISSFECMNFQEEFDFVSENLDSEILRRHYIFDLDIYKKNIEFIKKVIFKLDNSKRKQFLHKDIWPWNLIDGTDGIYLLDFNDWAIGDPIIELSVPLLEFGMFKSNKFNMDVAKNIIKGYKSIKSLSFTSIELWESVLFICYLYFPYNVIQADDKFESEIYLKRIDTLLKNPDIFNCLV